MKKFNFLKGMMLAMVTALIVAIPIAGFLSVSPIAVVGAIGGAPLVNKLAVTARLGFLPNQSNTFAFMAVQREVWVDYIIGNLFRDNEFMKYCYDESENVLNGTVVHIPQAGSKPNVVKNRKLFPGASVQRTDTDVTYPLDWYTTDATVITDAESKEVSYSKIDSVLGEHVDTLNDSMAEDMLYKWSPTLAASIIRTTGAVADNVALAPTATGTRKPLLLADLRKAKVRMNKAGISKKDRYALIPDDMLSQLMTDPEMKQYTQNLMDLKEGTVPRLEGFQILTRAQAGIYDNTATPIKKDPTAAGATTDNLSVLCWQKNSLAKAVGATKFFDKENDPNLYGDAYSMGQRAGGRIRRAGEEGVIAIVQTT